MSGPVFPGPVPVRRTRPHTKGLVLEICLAFMFTVDRLSEGVDMLEVNMVLFLRPIQSLTVFLQQLGRGLRHAPEKNV